MEGREKLVQYILLDLDCHTVFSRDSTYNVSDRVIGHNLDIGHPMTTANGMLYSHNSTTIG